MYENKDEKIWIDNLKHPTVVGNQGAVLISMQMMPEKVAEDVM